MPIQQFNDRFLGNAPVPTAGQRSGSGTRAAGYDGEPKAGGVGTPAGLQTFDPTANLKADYQTFHAERSDTPMGTAKFTPSTVDSFADSDVR